MKHIFSLIEHPSAPIAETVEAITGTIEAPDSGAFFVVAKLVVSAWSNMKHSPDLLGTLTS